MDYKTYTIKVDTGFSDCVHDDSYHPSEYFTKEEWYLMSDEQKTDHLNKIAREFMAELVTCWFE